MSDRPLRLGRQKSGGACSASRRSRREKSSPRCSAARGREVDAIASRDAGRGVGRRRGVGDPEGLRLLRRRCSPIPTSTPSTSRCPTTCTCRGRSAPRKRASTSSARSRSALSAAEAAQLIAVRDRTGVQIEEAFMVRTHPQWLRALDIVRSGRIGAGAIDRRVLQLLQRRCVERQEHDDVRRRRAAGHRLLPGQHGADDLPGRAAPRLRADRAGPGAAASTGCRRCCSTSPAGTRSARAARSWRRRSACTISGTRGRIEIEIPFNAPPDRPCRIVVEDGSNLGVPSREHDRRSRPAISTPSRGTCFRGRCARGPRCPIRSKTRSATCASSTRCSARPGPTPGNPSKPVLSVPKVRRR